MKCFICGIDLPEDSGGMRKHIADHFPLSPAGHLRTCVCGTTMEANRPLFCHVADDLVRYCEWRRLNAQTMLAYIRDHYFNHTLLKSESSV